MIGIVIAAHAKLADALLDTARHVTQFEGRARAVGIVEGDTTASYEERLRSAVEEVNAGAGVLILTDMFGGTPSNVGMTLHDSQKVEVLTGANLPMLIKLASVRAEGDLTEAVKAAHEAGRKYINVASWVLSGEAADS